MSREYALFYRALALGRSRMKVNVGHIFLGKQSNINIFILISGIGGYFFEYWIVHVAVDLVNMLGQCYKISKINKLQVQKEDTWPWE